MGRNKNSAEEGAILSDKDKREIKPMERISRNDN